MNYKSALIKYAKFTDCHYRCFCKNQHRHESVVDLHDRLLQMLKEDRIPFDAKTCTTYGTYFAEATRALIVLSVYTDNSDKRYNDAVCRHERYESPVLTAVECELTGLMKDYTLLMAHTELVTFIRFVFRELSVVNAVFPFNQDEVYNPMFLGRSDWGFEAFLTLQSIWTGRFPEFDGYKNWFIDRYSLVLSRQI